MYGRPSDIEGTDINGSIVLLNLNSGDNWINMASLGAKGAIFIEPLETTR